MAKQRYINTRFWSDNYVVELKPLERYLFLYFLTNEHTNIGGIYELPLRNIAFETDLKESIIVESLQKFTKAGKVFYIEGWVYVKNFSKHQAVNEKTKIGIENSLKEVAPSVLALVKQIDMGSDIPSMEYELSKSKCRSESKLRERLLEHTPSFLKQIPEEDIKEWTDRFDVSPGQIKGKAEDLINWLEANGKEKKNYRAFLLNAIKRDFKERDEADRLRKQRIEESRMAGPSAFSQSLLSKMKM